MGKGDRKGESGMPKGENPRYPFPPLAATRSGARNDKGMQGLGVGDQSKWFKVSSGLRVAKPMADSRQPIALCQI